MKICIRKFFISEPIVPGGEVEEGYCQKMVSQLPNHRQKAAMCLGEVVGTAMLMLFGCMGCAKGVNPNTMDISPALGFGLTVMMVIMTFGHVSGAHLNPVVSIAAVLFGTLPVLMLPLYCIAQAVGALLGYALLKAITPGYLLIEGGQCVTMIHPGITVWEGLFAEFLMTSCLVLICCGVWDSRNSNKVDSVAIKFGFAVAALSLVGGAYTGCSMNPVRSLAPAVFNNHWENHWVYWVGPTIAGFLPTWVYIYLFRLPANNGQAQDD